MDPCETELICSEEAEIWPCLLQYFDLYVNGLLIHCYSATVWLYVKRFLQTYAISALAFIV